ncbi:hypothetical protein [Demequina iriomotensis]|uniref:hypothetical protein n=1 Tax=Demequina iriomotensis TaxID=1536641 RepID=UPI0007810659|nr:hypothetical protein [Demequina iriomotensis]
MSKVTFQSFDADKARDQAADAAKAAREAAREASVAARKAAKRAKEWAGPQVEHAKDWASPRVQEAYHSGAKKASPYVRKAGETTEHWVDVAHAAIVGAAIPAVIAAVDDAARSEPEDKGGRSWSKVLVPLALAAAAGAAVVVWARRDQGRDAWAGEDEEWEFAAEGDLKDTVRRNVNKAVDAAAEAAKKAADAATAAANAAAEVITDKAGPTYEKVREAAGPAAEHVKDTAVTEAKKVADVAGPAFTKVKDTAIAEAKKVKEAADEARARAAEEVVSTIDDAGDVWEDAVEELSDAAENLKGDEK